MKLHEKHKDFFQNVHDVVRLVPVGRVTTYGAIARYLGTPRSSRMVGWAMNAAAGKPDIPAHRVVNRTGMLTGKVHFAPPERMAMALASEGILVTNDTVQDFANCFWDPSAELTL